MRHYAHHIGDYRAATAHLSFAEDAAYRRLLDLYYLNERPLAADIGACQRLVGARSKDERTAVETVLREFFTLDDDGWHQSRADDEIGAYQARADVARENGQRGGRPKTQRKPSHNPSGSSTGTQTKPDEKLTKNQEPVTSNQEPVEEEISRAFGLFNDATKRTGWPTAQRIDEARRQKMRARLSDAGGLEGFAVAIGKAEASEFLTVTWPNFNIDWLLKPANFTKVMEGNYDKRNGSGQGQSGLSAALAGLADEPVGRPS